jgi:hypothetical protein
MARRGNDETSIPENTRCGVCPMGDKRSLKRKSQRQVRPEKNRFVVCPIGDKESIDRKTQRNVRSNPCAPQDLSRNINPDDYFQTYDEALIKKYYNLVDEIKEIKARNPIQYEAIADSEKELITIYNELKGMGITVQPYEGYEAKESPAPDIPDASLLTKQRAIYRTKVTPKAYMNPYIDALDDIYCTLLGDIRVMKAADPVPQEVLAEAEEELRELKKEMEKAGFEFSS